MKLWTFVYQLLIINLWQGLPIYLSEMLELSSTLRQRSNLNRKLKQLCDTSKWKTVGSDNLVTNLSMRPLSPTEKEALSLGLKFDSGVDRCSYTGHVDRNYRWSDNDTDKGFIQGILAVCKILADKEPESLPKRYLKALEGLAEDKNVIVTQADKGGGVIIMDSSEYLRKLSDLLTDAETYAKKEAGFGAKQSKQFNKSARKILKRSEEGKRFLHLLEEAPKSPKLKGLPKVHKDGIPMRPIISGIGSAPHKIARVMAKPLSKALGTISGSHLRNSTELIEQLKNIDMRGKKLASFDVKSLFTNVPVDGALDAIAGVIDIIDERLRNTFIAVTREVANTFLEMSKALWGPTVPGSVMLMTFLWWPLKMLT